MGTLPTNTLPWYLNPIPQRIETLALTHAWVIVAVNLIGTAFGFWYYLPQFRLEPLITWPVIPDSPMATLLIALSLALYKLDRSSEYLNVLAFFGCIKLGLWTPYVLTVFADAFLATVAPPSQVVSLLGSDLGWYGFNDLVDYFVPIVGTAHHTLLPVEPILGGVVQHVSPAHEIAAAGAVALTFLATALAEATRRVN
jgi:uncharacterized membrane protein YpjA